MPGIFISYRREDSAGWTGRLAERLKVKFGTESIFMDIDTIQPGTDFAEALHSAVGSCDVLLAMIGPKWCIATNPEGQPRLGAPNDWVRTELTAALNRSIPVIPVLVGGADLPKVETLPDDLKKLFQYQTHELTDKRWEFDSSQLELVLEKVLGGGKPKRNIKQTLLAYRGALAAIGIVGIGLAIALVSPVTRWSSQATGNAQTNDGGIVTKKSVASLPSSEPTAQSTSTEPADSVQAVINVESSPAQPVSVATDPETTKVVTPTHAEDPKGRSLPAGIEVKFNAGDVILRLTSIRLEDPEEKRLLSLAVSIKNIGSSGFGIYGNDAFRLIIDGSRHAPVKATPHIGARSDSEGAGEVTFAIPKTVRRTGFRVIVDETETTIPIDLQTGVSRSDVQPPGIPRSLAKPARIIDVAKNNATFDFRPVALEPYNIESFLLRIPLRITTHASGLHFYGSEWRLLVEDLSYAPIKASSKGVAPNTYADVEVLFIVPKSANQVTLRVPDGDTWRNVPINLKGSHS